MDKANNFISSLMIAVSNCSLYSKEHESFDDLAKKVHTVLLESMDGQFEIMVLDNDLVVNNTPVRSGGLHRISLLKRFNKKGIARVEISPGVSLAEIKQFIVDLSASGHVIKTYPHITAGSVNINDDMEAIDTSLDIFSFEEELGKLKESFDSISFDKKLQTVALHEIVVRFIATFKREKNILKFLSPVKDYSEYTYIHAANVSVLSMFQAKTLGISDDVLHEIGIAGLLHDTGKLFISNDILNKNGKLDDDEFNEIKKHPVLGARYLTKMDDITRLAPVAAFEHHMNYDGSGYPALNFKKKKQHFCSQIVAISDFFDAMRSRRPYRESWDVDNIFAIMKKNSGTQVNPLLLDHFIKSILDTLTPRQEEQAVAD
jgi:HD-GYP domain-containing protein (c-di-GMP phosphodiesterase class II)